MQNNNNLPYGEQQIINQEQKVTWENFIDWCSASYFGKDFKIKSENQALYPNLYNDNTDWFNFRTSYFGFTEWCPGLNKLSPLDIKKTWEQNVPSNFRFGNPREKGRSMSYSTYQEFKKMFDEWKETL